jgi:NAD(P)H dehydrogenase (quinone)
MILATGATGFLGSAVVEQMRTRTSADNFVAFARNKEKAKRLTDQGIQVRYGNFDDPASFDKAIQGHREGTTDVNHRRPTTPAT